MPLAYLASVGLNIPVHRLTRTCLQSDSCLRSFSAARAAGEVIPQAVSDDAPDRQLIVLQDVAWGVGRVLRAQDELAPFLCQALYQDIAVEAGNNHMPRPGCDSAADDQMVTVEYACT